MLVTAALALIVLACRPFSFDRSFHSQNPLDRVRAIVQAAEAGDTSAIHQLVSLLEDRDQGVRMYAILGLRRLCGVDYGYRYYEGPDERAAAVERWREAMRRGEVTATASSDTELSATPVEEAAP